MRVVALLLRLLREVPCRTQERRADSLICREKGGLLAALSNVVSPQSSSALRSTDRFPSPGRFACQAGVDAPRACLALSRWVAWQSEAETASLSEHGLRFACERAFQGPQDTP